MIIGQALVTHDDTTGQTYYSSWFWKGGNAAVFMVDVIQASSDVDSFTVTVETKAAEDDDDGGSLAVGSAQTITLTADTRTTFERGTGITGAGLKELVRFKYVVTQVASPTYLGFVHFRMLNPSWLSD